MLKPAESSIFFKLLLILIATGVLINLVVIEGTRFLVFSMQKPHAVGLKNFQQYAGYIQKDLGEPPSREKANILAGKLGLGIRYHGDGENWTTSEDVPSAEKLSSEHIRKPKWYSLVPGEHRHRYVVLKTARPNSDGELIIVEASPPRLEPSSVDLIGLIAVVTLIVATSYIFIRRALKPVTSLSYGVDQIKSGNLKHRVPIMSRDELGKLAESFNQMTGQIRQVIEGKEQLLIDVSHELRSPLTRAKVSLELVKEELPKQQIGEDLDEMEIMIHELLESARLDSQHGVLSNDSVDLPELIQTVVGRYKDSSVPVAVEITDPIVLKADRDRLLTVLKNLVDNAIKYSPASSTVLVKLSARDKHAFIQVVDRGIGIPVSELTKVFEPFYRTDKSRNRLTGGFGLGLSLCRKIVRAHGGEISITSEEKIGTTVTVSLPV